jgi:Carbohydrate esterase, sialic acid-specific acetylesterase
MRFPFAGFWGALKQASLTGNRVWSLPDRSGEIVTAQGPSPTYNPIVTVSTSKTFTLTDLGTYQDCTNGSAITLSIPLNSAVVLPIGFSLEVNRRSAPVTVRSTAGIALLQDGILVGSTFNVPQSCKITKIATDTWSVKHADDRPYRYLLVIAGESNSGGAAPVSGLPANDLTAVTFVKIWNNSTNLFENLQIGTNNLINHTGFTNNINVGIERGLIRDQSVLGLNEIYLLKAGQGGSTIAQWATGDSSGYLSTLTSRYLSAKASIEAAGYKVKPIFVWWLGLNDAAIPTAPLGWRSSTQTLFSSIRSLMGVDTPIYIYKLMTNTPNDVTRASYNTEIDTMVAADPILYAVTIPTGAEQQVDGTHYTIHGYVSAWNALSDRLLNTTGFSSAATRGASRGSGSNKPIFAAVHTAGTSLPHLTTSTAATLPLFTTYDPDGCFFSNGFRVPSWAAGEYMISYNAGTTAGCTQLAVSILVNGIGWHRAPVTVLATDGIFTNGTSCFGFLAAGDIVNLSVSQSNTGSAPRTFITTGLQRPLLQLFRLGE